MRKNVVRWLPFFLPFILVIALDQVTKEWVLANMALGETVLPIPELHPFFQLTRSANTGAAFGIFPDAGPGFLILAILISTVIVFLQARSEYDAHLMHLAFGLVVGGALGNVIDRIQHGHVVDFIHYHIPNLVSNVSNLADHAIVFGVILLLIDNLLRERRQKRQNAAESDSPQLTQDHS